MIRRIVVGISILVSLIACKTRQDRLAQFKSVSPYGQFAPSDAFSENSRFAYYGSENQWNRRMFSKGAADRMYKRRGQRQLLAILDGYPEQALRWCQQRLAADSSDLESLFVLTLAYVRLGQLQKAFYSMKTAVAKGLPFGRFLAGPRRLLKPLTDSPLFQEYARRHRVLLAHGPMIGAVTATRARFWLRTVREAEVHVAVQKNGKTVAFSPNLKTTSRTDFSAVLEVNGLKPQTDYQYQILVDRHPVFRDTLPAFSTYPVSGTSGHFRLAFGGGAGYNPPHERIWDVISRQRPQAFLFMGDNVYLDLPQMPGPFHQYTYYRRQSRPEFRQFTALIPIYAIWDDHDSAIDDVWLGPYRNKPSWKMPLFKFFKQNWNNPYYGSGEWPGCWFDFSLGDVDVFMLDGRTYRTNPFAPKRTMLGPVQKQWLFEKLKNSRATFKIIASPVPWAAGAKPESKDTWNGFPEERQEIFNFITRHHIAGVILLSADRHRSDVWRIDRNGAYPLYEFESSKLTNAHTHQKMPGALFSYNEKCSFGLLEFFTRLPDPQVSYRIINIDGQEVYRITLYRSALE